MNKLNQNDSPQHFIDSLGLDYICNPITARPDKTSLNDMVYHYHVTISNHAGSWSGYYSMGSAHRVIKPYESHMVLSRADYDRLIKKQKPSTLWEEDMWPRIFAAPRPTLVDVLYSLAADSDALNYSGFEDWAASFGYDTDSRSAETTYRACLETGLKLKAMLGGEGLELLREIYQDY